MRGLTLRIPPPSWRPGLHWLLWLALLLPVAQSAAQWHGAAHALQEAGGQRQDPPSTDAPRCELCAAAAVLGAGGLAAPPLALPGWLARFAVPAAGPGQAWLAPTTPVYRSRAPPFAVA